jgi:hypothetical protein
MTSIGTRAILLSFTLLALSGLTWAQGRADLRGTVADSSGAVIPNLSQIGTWPDSVGKTCRSDGPSCFVEDTLWTKARCCASVGISAILSAIGIWKK